MILDMRSIYKDYMQGKEAVPVLKNIDFQVDENEYVAIMGPSGSGKSTLMNIIGCLDKQTSGTFIFDGKDISQCKDKELSDIRNRKCRTSAALCRSQKKGTQGNGKAGADKGWTRRQNRV